MAMWNPWRGCKKYSEGCLHCYIHKGDAKRGVRATYTQIKDYVLEHNGLKVSNLYISQIKRKCGIEVGQNYNLPKSEDSRQPQCPPEKEKAIREAFKYFGMI